MRNPTVSDSETFQQFAEIVAASLRIEPERVTREAYLSDLGAESLDVLEITMEAEDHFAIVMPEKDILQLAQEIVGHEVLVRNGQLSELGARLLRHRMPYLDSAAIFAGMPLNEVARLFQRVDTWVRVINGLVEQSPRSCPSCGAPLSRAIAGQRKCTACAKQIDLPAGDELNRRWIDEYFRNDQALARGAGGQ